MIVIKNINNNVSLCLDSNGREVVAFGKGIGFIKPPYEVPLERVQRTFYNIDETYLNVIVQISEEIINISTEIFDYANRRLNNCFSANVIFTIADHIQFALQREKEHINIQLPLLYEVRNLYPAEMEIGMYALEKINREFNVCLPTEEAASITLHFVVYGLKSKVSHKNEKTTMERCTEIIEHIMNITIDKKGFNYSRFLIHMHYLLDRVRNNQNIATENEKMFLELKRQYPKTYRCALEIEKFLKVQLSDEERLYLILHINRLCVHEDCYQ